MLMESRVSRFNSLWWYQNICERDGLRRSVEKRVGLIAIWNGTLSIRGINFSRESMHWWWNEAGIEMRRSHVEFMTRVSFCVCDERQEWIEQNWILLYFPSIERAYRCQCYIVLQPQSPALKWPWWQWLVRLGSVPSRIAVDRHTSLIK